MSRAVKAAREFEDFFVSAAADDTCFDSCHKFSLLVRACFFALQLACKAKSTSLSAICLKHFALTKRNESSSLCPFLTCLPALKQLSHLLAKFKLKQGLRGVRRLKASKTCYFADIKRLKATQSGLKSHLKFLASFQPL